MSIAFRKSVRALSLVKRYHSLSRPVVGVLSNRVIAKGRVLRPSSHCLSMAAGKTDTVKSITIEEVVGEGKKGVPIIDVREQVEIHNTGLIPGSINIPLGTLEEAFKLPPDQFKERYSINKPEKNDPIILSCQSGNRSRRATIALQSMGYANVMNNAGGWKSYEELTKGI